MAIKRIAVFPGSQRSARAGLFAALEAIAPVRFEPGRRDGRGYDAAVAFPGAASRVPAGVPVLVTLDEEGAAGPLPLLGTPAIGTGPQLTLGGRRLDRALRGAALRDATVLAREALTVEAGEEVLAARDGMPVWVCAEGPHGRCHRVAVAAAELADGEALRDRLRDGRFLAVAALVSFVREVCGPEGFGAPRLSACFLFDDPNLHWTTYGYLRYAELLREADAHGYHVAMATIPIDGWLAHPGAVRMFRTRPDRLSLVVHGNNHQRLELARELPAAAAHAMLVQALRRVAAFERRTAVPVARIMVAPHGVCSREVARALVPAGFDALCISRPYPWLARRGRPWLTRPPGSSSLTGWQPGEVIENGLPVLLRRGIGDPPADLALRAFLRQPLIIQAHHDDMRGGLDRLGEVAGLVNRLGDVRWCSLAEIAGANVTTQREGDQLRVAMFTRRARLAIPAGVRRVAVSTPTLDDSGRRDAVVWTRADRPSRAPLESVCGGSCFKLADDVAAVRVSLVSQERPADTEVVAPRLPLRVIARRVAAEARDRALPAYARLATARPPRET